MCRPRLSLSAGCFIALWTATLFAQTASMPGVENSVGYLAAGTSIEPRTTSESTPMLHGSYRNWMVMFHANVFAVDLQQTGPRGQDKAFSTNWMMPMMYRRFSRHGLMLRGMFSLEPGTITNQTYPLLFQTGETAHGFSIINGQHPHELIMELAGRYDFNLSDRSQIFVYGGPIGDAALGPTAFPHRSSASENPLAPLGHHMQDSTHIASNVITIGLAQGPVQVEASTFSGREPDENRWNIDSGKPDSFSTRLTVSPTNQLTAQVSTGRINNPEALDPNLDTVRTTASLEYNADWTSGHLSSSLIWGRNKDLKNGTARIFNSYSLEITSRFHRNWIWTRIENLDRDRTLLPVPASRNPGCLLCGLVGKQIQAADAMIFDHGVLDSAGTPVTIDEDPAGRLQAYTLGYERELPVPVGWLNTGIGVQATTYGLPPQFKAAYGNHPWTIAMFLRFRPSGNMRDHMKLMHQK